MTDPFAPGLLSRLPEPPRKVALLRASRIGDFLCAVPVFRALRAALPDAEITMVTLPLLRDLTVRSPYLDRFVAFPGFPGIAEQLFDARRATAFFQEMQAEQFDLAVQMQGSGVYSNPFTLMLGARMTAGFVRPGDPPGRLDAALPLPEREHEVRRMLALATFLGVPPRGEELEYPLWPEDHATAEALLARAARPLIGLHPGARARTRRWALDRFAAVGAQLRRRYGGTIVILGDAEARPAAGMVAQQVDGPCLNLAGRTSLAVLGGVIARLAVLVTNDSGPAHVAYALGTATVTVLGGGRPAAYVPLMDGPYRILSHEVPCRPCDYADCPLGYTCLQSVTVQQAVEAAGAVIL
ncbi:MAG TPA: glycosyltransferase family 9 protein [Chloroflexota bacterium]|nr:glycosyltransferase family 9 protein [Chloroflexota bacterium]